MGKIRRENLSANGDVKLANLLDDNKLFATYQQLREVKVVKLKSDNNFLLGTYRKDTIKLKELDDKSTLYHEIQHIVQDIEDFARGVNSATHPNYDYLHGEVEARNVENRFFENFDDFKAKNKMDVAVLKAKRERINNNKIARKTHERNFSTKAIMNLTSKKRKFGTLMSVFWISGKDKDFLKAHNERLKNLSQIPHKTADTPLDATIITKRNENGSNAF